jgi:uncharacterized protein (DUF427 family)
MSLRLHTARALSDNSATRRHAMAQRSTVVAFWALLALMAAVPNEAVAEPPPRYFVDESKLPFEALPGTSTTRYWGVHGGAGYRIEVPDNWNGELVLYVVQQERL